MSCLFPSGWFGSKGSFDLPQVESNVTGVGIKKKRSTLVLPKHNGVIPADNVDSVVSPITNGVNTTTVESVRPPASPLPKVPNGDFKTPLPPQNRAPEPLPPKNIAIVEPTMQARQRSPIPTPKNDIVRNDNYDTNHFKYGDEQILTPPVQEKVKKLAPLPSIPIQTKVHVVEAEVNDQHSISVVESPTSVGKRSPIPTPKTAIIDDDYGTHDYQLNNTEKTTNHSKVQVVEVEVNTPPPSQISVSRSPIPTPKNIISNDDGYGNNHYDIGSERKVEPLSTYSHVQVVEAEINSPPPTVIEIIEPTTPVGQRSPIPTPKTEISNENGYDTNHYQIDAEKALPPLPSTANQTKDHVEDYPPAKSIKAKAPQPTGILKNERVAILNEPVKDNVRKEGISSGIVNVNPEKEIRIDIFDKDDQSKKLIKTAIQANDFLNNMMDENRLETVTLAMKLQTFQAGSNIILEGETGSHFFVSAEGEFEVIKDGTVIKTFGSGVVFGELAILYKAKRFASIKVTTNAKIWSLERKMFQRIMMKSGRLEKEENMRFLKSVSVLRDLPESVLLQVADLLKREFHATGSTIIHQGDEGDKFYIIRGGSVTVTKRDSAGQEKKVGTLKRGEYFGEQALLHSDRRLASIYANEPGTECLTLDRIAFETYLGPIDKIRDTKPIDQIPLEKATAIEPIKQIVNPKYQHVRLDDLKTIGTLGVGGFGRVELVQYKQETFALKFLKKVDMVQQQQQEHAYSEKDIMASCDSPFIVKLFNTYRDSKYLYFLMEACLGGDVWTVLQKKQYFDEKTSRFMTGCVIEAFEYLHSRNMIYRDLKPENLMLDNRGYVKVVDFGFAKRINPTHKTWTFAGTPEYVAPEIILNKGHDRAVDYWALGVFIHELFVGKPPFRGKDHMKTYNMILRGIDVHPMHSRIPKKAQDLIKKLCRQIPAERIGYQRNGITDIKKHGFFVGFDWDKLRAQTMPAPLVRPVKSNTDLSNFDEYQKDKDIPPDENSGWDIHF